MVEGGPHRPQTERRAAVQAAVLQAAEELLDEGHTYANLKVEQIATRAGIGRTAFYFYFRDKRELLMHLTESVVAALFEQSERFWQGDPSRGVADIAEVLHENIPLYMRHANVLRAVNEMAAVDEVVGEFWRGMVTRFVEANSDRIADEVASGRSEIERPRETAMALIWMCERTLYEWARADSGRDPAPLIEAITGIWQRSIYGSVPAQK